MWLGEKYREEEERRNLSSTRLRPSPARVCGAALASQVLWQAAIGQNPIPADARRAVGCLGGSRIMQLPAYPLREGAACMVMFVDCLRDD